MRAKFNKLNYLDYFSQTKNENMKTKISPNFSLFTIVCTTSHYTNNYYDPNYLTSDEFIVTTPVKENDNEIIEEDYEELELLGVDTFKKMKEQL